MLKRWVGIQEPVVTYDLGKFSVTNLLDCQTILKLMYC
jgi:hypothetical protein